MTATERLRQLLDERGVEWQEHVWGGKHSVTTLWRARGVRWHYRENRFAELRLHADGLDPEQAVDATLGRGTCKVEGSIDYGEFGCWQYDLSCGCRILWPDSEPPKFCPECGRKVEP